jgi:hypothetical protein
MENKIELTAEQLAGLDLIIAKKEKGMKFDPENKEDISTLIESGPSAFLIQGFNKKGGDFNEDLIQHSITIAHNASLDDLLALRQQAILKQ